VNARALERMQDRARSVRARAAVRGWQYRQRHLAAGVCFRLRRVLADARAMVEAPRPVVLTRRSPAPSILHASLTRRSAYDRLRLTRRMESRT
jgi:hypothetical protein